MEPGICDRIYIICMIASFDIRIGVKNTFTLIPQSRNHSVMGLFVKKKLPLWALVPQWQPYWGWYHYIFGISEVPPMFQYTYFLVTLYVKKCEKLSKIVLASWIFIYVPCRSLQPDLGLFEVCGMMPQNQFYCEIATTLSIWQRVMYLMLLWNIFLSCNRYAILMLSIYFCRLAIFYV